MRLKRKYNRHKAFNVRNNRSSGDMDVLSENSHNSEANDQVKKYVDIQIKMISYICRNCDRKFSTEEDLIYHMNEEAEATSSDGYKCKICEKTFKNNKILRTHVKNLHVNPRKTYECCGHVYVKEEKYVYHMNKFHNDELDRLPNGEFLCKYCKKNFRAYQTVVDHINNIHTKDQSFLCNICGKTYYSLVVLRHHTKKHSLPEEPKIKLVFECPYCSKECRTAESLEAHKITAHTENFDKLLNGKYKCKHCGKETVAKVSMDEHINFTHLHTETFLCDVCGKDCYSTISLRKHKIIHLKTRQFQCSLCPKTFKQRHDVRKHYYNVHDASRRYGCPICDKNFRKEISLKRHINLFHKLGDAEQKLYKLTDGKEETFYNEDAEDEDQMLEEEGVKNNDNENDGTFSNIETLIIEDAPDSEEDESKSLEDEELNITGNYYKNADEWSNGEEETEEGENEGDEITIYEFYD